MTFPVFYLNFSSDPLTTMLTWVALAVMVAAFVVQSRVNSTFHRYNQVLSRRRITGAEAAEMVLRKNGVYDCRIETTPGELTDHYDPRANVIRLSKTVYQSTSVAAIGVAAHEAGHAVQYATGYTPIKVRAKILPIAQLGSNMGIWLALLGFALSFLGLVYIGIALFSFTTLFSLLTLPLEFNASRRALQAIGEPDMLDEDEKDGARKVLTMAALTYVVSFVSSLVHLLRLLSMANSRRR